METVIAALGLYGATLNEDGFICRNGKTCFVKPVIKKGRLRFEGQDGNLIASGGVTEKWVCQFVENFWFWVKK